MLQGNGADGWSDSIKQMDGTGPSAWTGTWGMGGYKAILSEKGKKDLWIQGGWVVDVVGEG